MTYTWQNKSSFLFGETDMYQTFGIQIADNGEPEDVLLPELRSRKVIIPLKNGAYDYGAKYYDERAIGITCVTVKAGSRNDAREMAYILSKKQKIYFWNEPDKYYIGRVYQAPGLEVLRNVGNRFSLVFVCEPFAYGSDVSDSFTNGNYTVNYAGTASTPTYISITNNGTDTAVNIRITQVQEQENL